jgi:ribosomal protein S18 acetylase RimI-like enzyme
VDTWSAVLHEVDSGIYYNALSDRAYLVFLETLPTNMSTPNLTIRTRQPTDLPSCASLLARVYEKDRYPVQGVSHAIEFLSSPSTLAAWVAVQPPADEDDTTQEAKVLGHVALTSPSTSDPAVALWYSQNRPEPIAVMERLFVDPEARGQRLAERLMRAVSEEAERRGMKAVLFTLIKDVGAMRLYERVGWQEFGRSVYAYQDHEGRATEMEAVCYVAPGGV